MKLRPEVPRERLNQIANQTFLGTKVAYDAGRADVRGHKDQPLNLPVAFPYGFKSDSPPSTDSNPQQVVITRTAAGLYVVSERNNLPDGVSEPEEGETLLYNSQGVQVLLDENGDLVMVQKSGRFVNMGSSPEFLALASKVNTELDRIQAAYDGHKHPYLPGPGASTPSGVPDTLLTTMGDVDAAEVKGT